MKILTLQNLRRLEPILSWTNTELHMSRSGRWRKHTSARKEARAATTKAKMDALMETADYTSWSQEKLIERVTQLEAELKSKNLSVVAPPTPISKKWKNTRNERPFDPSKYNTRLVAFKLAYLGKRYNGFEHAVGTKTPLPTIEEELWKAFNRARLVFPKEGTNPMDPGTVNWEGCEYSKCGRTDKGVSAFGQVIGIRVRSNRPLGKKKVVEPTEEARGEDQVTETGYPKITKEVVSPEDLFNTRPRANSIEMASPALAPSRKRHHSDTPPQEIIDEDVDLEESLNFDPIKDELPYISLLNRLLPPDIKILAWCPSPPLDFSARFSCRERQYRYFFTQPAFVPLPHNLEFPTSSKQNKNSTKMKDGWLNIEAMREAAKSFEGIHDFRNFCKIDPGKQISNFDRRIFYSDIEELDETTSALSFLNNPDFTPEGEGITSIKKDSPKIYTFTLHGSAFLWHQVRCMVAILFLVGQGLENPSIVKELLDTKKNPRRPAYEMANDTPLVLWNCVFPKEDDPDRKDVLEWIYAGDTEGLGDAKFGTMGLVDELWKVWREKKIDEMLAGSLISIVAIQGREPRELSVVKGKANKSQKVFDGGNVPRLQGQYTQVMKKPLMDSAEVSNEKYAVRKGFVDSADLKLRGYKRTNKLPGDPPVEEILGNGEK